MESLGKFVFVIIALFIGTLIGSYTVQSMFNWILVPMFAWTPISFMNAVRLSFVISLLKFKHDDKEETESMVSRVAKQVLLSLIYNAIALLILYLLSL